MTISHDKQRRAVRYLGTIRNPFKRTYGVKYLEYLSGRNPVVPRTGGFLLHGSSGGTDATGRYCGRNRLIPPHSSPDSTQNRGFSRTDLTPGKLWGTF